MAPSTLGRELSCKIDWKQNPTRRAAREEDSAHSLFEETSNDCADTNLGQIACDSRRAVLAASVIALGGFSSLTGAIAEEVLAPVVTDAVATAGPATATVTSGKPSTKFTTKQFNAFSLKVPATYTMQDALELARQSTIGSTPQLLYGNAAPPPSPLQARFFSPDQRQFVSIAKRDASSIRPMLLQVKDISQFGEPLEAAKLLVPPGATIVRAATITNTTPSPFEGNPGIERNYYIYEFKRGSLLGYISASARGGKVFVILGGDSSGKKDPAILSEIRTAVESFRIVEKFT
ncbi:hypothetical protein CYMTET_51016 [Cymbomonas tetramitiformis]|uniref:PsbP C-terminal domain-containing protein n=1 Tax=Cymbomonas tetramitiformis TaxID=36881 RepID=A0AAE0BN74_9CHLO|nr:hypothetical protein CYMTET_51016 [Cymbomonas tetramitiformis]